MSFLFAPPPQAVLPIVGEKNLYFPLHRVYFIGHNYSAHNKDMPYLFVKSSVALNLS